MASIFVRTFIIYIILAISIRLMGKRQIGELEVSELVSTLLISEIAALPIADPDIPLLNAIIPVLLIFSLELIISALKNKSEKLKRIVEGEPVFLVFKGKIKVQALKDTRLSINELLSEARLQGIGDFSEILYAILEQNGKISFIKNRCGEKFALPLIIDGEIKEEMLKETGISKERLFLELQKKRLTKDNVFLLTADEKKKLNIYIKEETKDDS